MDRKQFFKRLFGTAVVAAVAPSILAKEEETAKKLTEIDISKIPYGMSAEEVVNIYDNSGVILTESYPCTGAFESSKYYGPYKTQVEITAEQVYRYELEQGNLTFSEFLNKHK